MCDGGDRWWRPAAWPPALPAGGVIDSAWCRMCAHTALCPKAIYNWHQSRFAYMYLYLLVSREGGGGKGVQGGRHGCVLTGLCILHVGRVILPNVHARTVAGHPFIIGGNKFDEPPLRGSPYHPLPPPPFVVHKYGIIMAFVVPARLAPERTVRVALVTVVIKWKLSPNVSTTSAVVVVVVWDGCGLMWKAWELSIITVYVNCSASADGWGAAGRLVRHNYAYIVKLLAKPFARHHWYDWYRYRCANISRATFASRPVYAVSARTDLLTCFIVFSS